MAVPLKHVQLKPDQCMEKKKLLISQELSFWSR